MIPINPCGSISNRFFNNPNWRNKIFDLEKYFEVIGLPGFKANADLASLEKIIRGHLAAFIYQNSVLYNEGHKPQVERTIPSLDKDELFKQMVLKKHPGYCFQQLELIATVLEACGFNLSKYLAKILVKPTHQIDDSMLNDIVISHEIIMVNLE